MRVSFLDYCVIATYFASVIAVGFWLRARTKSSSEFFLSSRSLPAWVTGFAFMSANLGSLEVMGHAANGAKYGMMAASVFYWLGAIPAMVFLGIFMMPFYYNNRVRSSPEYLKLRFDERSRAFNAIGFAVLTILMSGINMYALALVFKVFLNWPIGVSTLVSALGVMVYIVMGGLRAAIYNEVIQFFLVFIGLLPLTFFGLREVGGWHGLAQRLPFNYVHAYAILGNSHDNPMGLPWYAIVVAFTMFAGTSYWCTVRRLLDEQFDVLPFELSRLGRILEQAVEIGTLDGILSCLKILEASVPHRFEPVIRFQTSIALNIGIASVATASGEVETVPENSLVSTTQPDRKKCCSSFPRIPSSYQLLLWEQESFLVLRSL